MIIYCIDFNDVQIVSITIQTNKAATMATQSDSVTVIFDIELQSNCTMHMLALCCIFV